MDIPVVDRMKPFEDTIFVEMTQRALAADAVNLGQGAPDGGSPPEVLAAATEAIESGFNQYPPLRGVPVLREAIVEHQKRFRGIDLDPDENVLVTVGATEGISNAILALCSPGDEVVMFEPYYDSYAASVALAGATRRTSLLRFPDFAIDEASLRAAFTDRTRLVMLNTPHNPTGKVFTRAELELVAELARQHDAIVVVDEVYEHLVYDGEHVPMASLPGMFDRTLTISSAGKTFAVTGWKTGWITGPAHLIDAVRIVKQYTTFTVGGPFQPAVAVGLRLPEEHFARLRARMRAKRDRLTEGLQELGLPTAHAQGGYFVLADCSEWNPDALALCRELPDKIGVAAVPVSAFHDDPATARGVLRFSFCKEPDVIEEGLRRLRAGYSPA